MVERIPKTPGPDHPIRIMPEARHITVSVAGNVVADTRSAMVLQEAGYPVVHYIPRADVRMELLEKTQLRTYCPYKGDCSYYSIVAGGARSANAIWSYEHPYPAVARIEGYMAFYRERVDLIDISS
jgi:uncharacterized protein (DUF427 family)